MSHQPTGARDAPKASQDELDALKARFQGLQAKMDSFKNGPRDDQMLVRGDSLMALLFKLMSTPAMITKELVAKSHASITRLETVVELMARDKEAQEQQAAEKGGQDSTKESDGGGEGHERAM